MNVIQNIDYYVAFAWGKCRSYLQFFYGAEFTATKINDKIYLGDFTSACNAYQMQKHGITHVISVIVGVSPQFPHLFTYKTIYVNDQPWAPLHEHFEDCHHFIENAIQGGGKVLIHCMQGISRSSTILAYHLMKKYRISAEEAIAIIQERRPIVNPNAGFIQQLNQVQL